MLSSFTLRLDLMILQLSGTRFWFLIAAQLFLEEDVGYYSIYLSSFGL